MSPSRLTMTLYLQKLFPFVKNNENNHLMIWLFSQCGSNIWASRKFRLVYLFFIPLVPWLRKALASNHVLLIDRPEYWRQIVLYMLRNVIVGGEYSGSMWLKFYRQFYQGNKEHWKGMLDFHCRAFSWLKRLAKGCYFPYSLIWLTINGNLY